jgi:class 3 adenylate cyclase
VAATYAHLFVDLQGYSRMLAERGDREIVKVMRPYERIVRAALPRPSAEADHIGDAFHLVFSTAGEAVATAVAIADELQRHNVRNPDVRLPVKFAIEAGQATRRNGRLVGNALNVAAHLVKHSEPGQVLLADGAAALLRPDDRARLRDLGVWKLRGADGVHVYEARRPDPSADGSHRPKRLLATVLHTDIVESTATAAARRASVSAGSTSAHCPPTSATLMERDSSPLRSASRTAMQTSTATFRWASVVDAPMCGVRRTFGSARSGWSAANGSFS